MESNEKDNLEDVETFRAHIRWPDQPEGYKDRVIPWHNLLVAVRRSYVEYEFPVWSDLAGMPTQAAAQQLKVRLGRGGLSKELPPGNWKFRARTRKNDGRIVLQGCYHWIDNWNALLGTPGLLKIEHQFFRRFRQAYGDRDAHREVGLDYVLWMGGLDYPISPLDAIFIERLPSPID